MLEQSKEVEADGRGLEWHFFPQPVGPHCVVKVAVAETPGAECRTHAQEGGARCSRPGMAIKRPDKDRVAVRRSMRESS